MNVHLVYRIHNQVKSRNVLFLSSMITLAFEQQLREIRLSLLRQWTINKVIYVHIIVCIFLLFFVKYASFKVAIIYHVLKIRY